MMRKQTKIVASISDRRCDVDFIKELYAAGMNVVRMNTAHANQEGLEVLIENVRKVSNKIALLIDTKGPEVRTTACDEPIDYKTGDKVIIVGDPERKTTKSCIAVSYPNFINDVEVGFDVLIDDGEIDLKITGKEEMGISGELTVTTQEVSATEEEAKALAQQKKEEAMR